MEYSKHLSFRCFGKRAAISCALVALSLAALSARADHDSGLPLNYAQVDWVESQGAEYIDTGIVQQDNVKVALKFSYLSIDNSGNRYMFAVNPGGTGQEYLVMTQKDTGSWAYSLGTITEIGDSDVDKPVVDKVYDVVASYKSGTYEFTDGSKTFTKSGLTRKAVTSAYKGWTFYLFALDTYSSGAHKADFFSAARLYSCQIYTGEDETLVRDFVPCYDRTAEEYGLWDRVSGEFFGTGAGELKGADVPVSTTVVPPTIKSATYTGEHQAADVADTDDYLVVRNEGGTEAGDYDVELALVDSSKTWAEYGGSTNIVLTFRIDKATNRWKVEPTVVTGIAGRAKPKLTFGEAEVGEVTCNYDEETIAALPVGSYVAEFAVEGTDNFDGLTLNLPFAVLPDAGLPAGYTQVEYVESTASGGQYVDTGISKIQNNLKVFADLAFLKSGVGQHFFGATSSSSRQWMVSVDKNSYWRWAGNGTGAYGAFENLPTMSVGTRYAVTSVVTGGYQTVSVAADGVSATESHAVTISSATKSLYIFKLNATDPLASHARLYGCSAWTDVSGATGEGTLARQYVPCWSVSDECYGLYDTVSQGFRPSASSAAFRGSSIPVFDEKEQFVNEWVTEGSVNPVRWMVGETGEFRRPVPAYGEETMKAYYDGDPEKAECPAEEGEHTVTYAVDETEDYTGITNVVPFAIYTYETFPGVRKNQETGEDEPDTAEVTYVWNPRATEGEWGDTRNWMVNTFDCYGVPSNRLATVEFNTDAVVDLKGGAFEVKSHQLRVAEGVKVTFKDGTIDEDNDTSLATALGAAGSVITFENMTYRRNRINPATESTIVFAGTNVVEAATESTYGIYSPRSVNGSTLLVRDGETRFDGFMSTDSNQKVYDNAIIVSNAVLVFSKSPLKAESDMRMSVKVYDGQFKLDGMTGLNYDDYAFAIPAAGFGGKAPFEARNVGANVPKENLSFTVDVSAYERGRRQPLMKFVGDGYDNGSMTNRTFNLTTIPAEAKAERNARLYWENNALWYKQDSKFGFAVIVK